MHRRRGMQHATSFVFASIIPLVSSLTVRRRARRLSPPLLPACCPARRAFASRRTGSVTKSSSIWPTRRASSNELSSQPAADRRPDQMENDSWTTDLPRCTDIQCVGQAGGGCLWGQRPGRQAGRRRAIKQREASKVCRPAGSLEKDIPARQGAAAAATPLARSIPSARVHHIRTHSGNCFV